MKLFLFITIMFTLFTNNYLYSEEIDSNTEAKLKTPSNTEIKNAQEIILELLANDYKKYQTKKMTAVEFGDKILTLLEEAEEPAMKFTILSMAFDAYKNG